MLFIPGYLIATECTWPTELTNKFSSNWWNVLTPLICTHLFVVVGHLFMVGKKSVNLLQFIVSLSLPIEASIGIPTTIYRAKFANVKNDPSEYSLFHSEKLEMIGQIIGSSVIFVGFIIFCATNYQFITSGNGTLSPLNPPKKFVASGLYSYTRNPMILSVLLMLIGEILFFNLKNLGYFAASFFICKSAYFCFEEEPTLLKRFGEDYAAYCKVVPRWGLSFTPFTASKRHRKE